ncbi:hypothetical protein [Streptomyces lasiicapitis]
MPKSSSRAGRAQAAGAARPDVTAADISLLLHALAYATDLSTA